jgi:hypothetical protein
MTRTRPTRRSRCGVLRKQLRFSETSSHLAKFKYVWQMSWTEQGNIEWNDQTWIASLPYDIQYSII